MKASVAATILNSFIYKPGWEITARPIGSHLVMLNMKVNFQDSQPQFAPDYTKRLDNDLTGDLITTDEWTTREDVEAALLTILVTMEIHEVREFVRYRETRKSPAHPHNEAGKAFWATYRDAILASAASVA